jgi:hypothetical protein
MANNTLLKNTSQAALTLPEPYAGVLAAGASCIIADTPTNVQTWLGTKAGSLVGIETADTTDAPTPGYSSPIQAYAAGATPVTLPHYVRVAMVTASGAYTVNLPVNPSPNQRVTVKDAGGTAGSDTITVKTTDSSTIDGGSGSTGVALASTNYTKTTFISDGTNWFTV